MTNKRNFINETQEQQMTTTADTLTKDDSNATVDSTTDKNNATEQEPVPMSEEMQKTLLKHWEAIYFHMASIIDYTVREEIKIWKEKQLQELENIHQ